MAKKIEQVVPEIIDSVDGLNAKTVSYTHLDVYKRQMRRTLENTDHLTIRQAEVSEIMAEDGKIRGVKTFSGAVYYAKAVILLSLIHI